MTEVRFQKSDGRFFFVFLLAVCVFAVAEFIFFLTKAEDLPDLLFILLFLILFIGGIAFSICGLLTNYKGFLRLERNRLSGRFGLFRKLSCTVSEVESVACKRGTLYLYLKNGKKHVISGIRVDTAKSFCFALRRLIPAKEERPDDIRSEVNRLASCYKKGLWRTLLLILSGFVMILLTALLTEWRNTSEFTSADRILFDVFALLFATWIVILILCSRRVSKYPPLLELRKYDLCWTTAFDFPTDPQIVAIYVSDDLDRVILRRIPGTNQGYYTFESASFDEAQTSEIFPDVEALLKRSMEPCWHEIPRNLP